MSSRSVSHRMLRTASALTLTLGTGLAGSAVLSGTAHAARAGQRAEGQGVVRRRR